MNQNKIDIRFSGDFNTKAIAELTSLFSSYNVNILDISMYETQNNKTILTITCTNSSTTDEIDSFWNDLKLLTENLNIIFDK